MAVTAVTLGYGSVFAVGDGASPEVFTDLAEVINITPPSDNLDIVDATHMGSPNATREFIFGLNDPGEASFEMNFIPGSAADLKIQAIRLARLKVNCRVTFPNLVKWTFAAILSGYEPADPVDDRMTATVTFKVTGITTVS